MFGYTEEDVRAGHMGKLRGEVTKKGIPSVCEALHIGEPTLMDILSEL